MEKRDDGRAGYQDVFEESSLPLLKKISRASWELDAPFEFFVKAHCPQIEEATSRAKRLRVEASINANMQTPCAVDNR